MAQLAISNSDTPARLVLEVEQDPFDLADPVRIRARIFAVDGVVMAAHSVTLKGLEQDFTDSIVQAAVECYRWGAPQSQLVAMMRYHHRQAKAHVKKHGG